MPRFINWRSATAKVVLVVMAPCGRRHHGASWCVSTGEVSIASKVEEDRNRRARAGQEVRILDIPADAGQGYGAFDAPREVRTAPQVLPMKS